MKQTTGQSPTYDSKAFLIEAMAIILDAPPTTQGELIRQTLNAYEKANLRGGRPSDEWAKREIQPLWRRLGLKGED